MLKTIDLRKEVSQRTILFPTTLQFFPGILYGLLGPNGSGKSTFLKTLAKIWDPTSGSVQWKGEDLHQKSRREISRTVSLVPQHTEMHFNFTVREVVSMGRHPHGENLAAEKGVRSALATVDALHLIDRPILALSHGERQRVLIARALVTESAALLLDEPASSLDIRHQLDIWHLMQELAKSGKIVIVANHDIALTRRFCDEVIVMHEGKCAAQGKTSSLLNEEILLQVFGVRECEGAFYTHSPSAS